MYKNLKENIGFSRFEEVGTRLGSGNGAWRLVGHGLGLGGWILELGGWIWEAWVSPEFKGPGASGVLAPSDGKRL